MRIYFVGSHATGKTTLCRYVSRRYGMPMISEVARAVLAEMESAFDALRTDMDQVADYQQSVFARQVATEHQHAGRFVSDRSFDNVAYAAEHSTVCADMMGDQLFTDYMKWVQGGVVFFLRPHQSLLKEDGVRAGVSWESVLRIDGMVKLLLEQHRIKYLPIESVSMQERVRAVEFVLDRAGIQPAPPLRPPHPTLPAAQLALPVLAVPVVPGVPAELRSESSGSLPVASGASDPSLRRKPPTEPVPGGVLQQTLSAWPFGLVDKGDHEA